MPRLLVTGATGQLGRLVVAKLLETIPAHRVVATTRKPDAATDLAALGVEVREADYDRPEGLDAALSGVDRILMISASRQSGSRTPSHRNVIEAARRVGVGLLAYTSILGTAATSELQIAFDHRETEEVLQRSGVPFVVLRNCFYTEVRTMFIPAALEHGQLLGCAGEGRFSFAARADYADAAAAVLASEGHAGRVYELAGDDAVTLAEFASEVARQSGKPISYRNLPESEFFAALLGAGVPEMYARMFADSDTMASQGGLQEEGQALSRLIGRPTTPLATVVTNALRGISAHR